MKKTLHGKRHVRARTKQIQQKNFIELMITIDRFPRMVKQVMKSVAKSKSIPKILSEVFHEASKW
jgi:hypothetical protein